MDRWTGTPASGAEVRYLSTSFDPLTVPAEHSKLLGPFLEWHDPSAALVDVAGVTARTDAAGYALLATKPVGTVIARSGDLYGSTRL